MLHQSIKDAYYGMFYWLSILLKQFYRIHYRVNPGKKRAQLGCGKNYLSGFVNIDGNINRKTDYLLDIRCGLPFPDESIELIYSCHMLEHLHINEAIKILEECFRVLSKNGYMRLTLPDFNFVDKILSGEEQYDFPRKFKTRSGQAINFLYCDGQHKYAYNTELITEIAEEIGFARCECMSVNYDINIGEDGKLNEPPGSFSMNLYKSIQQEAT